jgi:hypothetical protein
MENNGKWFGKFTTSELFTENVYELMKKHKDFMILVDNKEVLIDKQIDKWNITHNLNDTTKRIIYHYCTNKGYRINYNNSIYSILASIDLLDNDYNTFIENCGK